ncbi:MAG: acetyl-CoA carboxylase biotin carboxyl carrier protein subunit [Oscillospiraceae bacterium]|jgi:biotin carboxyl carrier protein|nr:acetyl-CoA carboxylase biotin carboxyl carrier protein subunit [Oscillospiraceae bacterium]
MTKGDIFGMKYDVTLKGKTFEVLVERGEAQLISVSDAAAPLNTLAEVPAAAAPPLAAAPVLAPAIPAAAETVTSPLPGVVVKVVAAPGTAVGSGQIVLVIEAMKMENEIAAPHSGTVGEILADKGARVDTGSPLFTLT